MVNAIRTVDPCALIPRAELGALGAVRSVRVRKPEWCEAELGPAESGKGTKFSWSLMYTTKGITPNEKGHTEKLGAVSVHAVSDAEAWPDKKDQFTERNCTTSLNFPSGAAVMMFTTTPKDTEPCPVAKSVLPTLLGNLDRAPAHGTSPDTPRTVLHGQDPCAAASALGVMPAVADQREWRCVFTYRGDEIEVEFTYDREQFFLDHEVVRIGDRDVRHDDVAGFHSYTAVVGPQVHDGDDSLLGMLVPIISVIGKDRGLTEEVVGKAVAPFPAG